ncbi:cytochrome P450 monooxygenase [Rhodofomes roseus]|uniref:Cytochrome P450 monooxygenase n=1 Tax=Rhodofomes roseus TaxID=34475 RepID=A0ABQ8K7D2_9APHY|nr:cytochrome P450 monooxygenase [Rhodofomes roseus]KAH9833165.1 cytochrome P450 monooxygenase [Rhodofomes roseus]
MSSGLLLSSVLIVTLLWRVFIYTRLLIASAPLNRLPGPPRESFWNGNLRQFLARHAEDFQKHVAVDFGPVVKMSGYFGRPLLYVSDSRALHNILIKEEHIFQEQEVFISSNLRLFGPSLLATYGQRHGKQRKILNPVFSINHMRSMLPLFYTVCHKLREAITGRLQDGPRELDMLHWTGRVSLELIGQGGLGYSFDPLVEDKEDPYGQAVKALIPNFGRVLHLRWLAVLADKWNVPRWLQRAVVQAFPADSPIRKLLEAVDTMDRQSRAIYSMKKRAFDQGDAEVVKQIGEGKDILSILMRANAQADVNERLSEEEVVAQLSTLIFAAMDTTSNTLSRTLQLLAQYPDVQDKLRRELLETGAAQGTSYDQLNQLPFLDAVCRETLRVHPAAGNRFRINRAVADTVLPLSEPVTTLDGAVLSKIAIPKGTEVLVGVMGSNMNRALWGEDALEWKPERWLSPLPSAVTDARMPGVYSNLLTFIGGKRSCIGFKFAEMEMKVVLAVMLTTFTFALTDKPILWTSANIMFPTVGRNAIRSELPLRVGLYKPARL